MDQPQIKSMTYRELWEEDQRKKKEKVWDDVDCRYSGEFEKERLNDDDDADCFCD